VTILHNSNFKKKINLDAITRIKKLSENVKDIKMKNKALKYTHTRARVQRKREREKEKKREREKLRRYKKKIILVKKCLIYCNKKLKYISEKSIIRLKQILMLNNIFLYLYIAQKKLFWINLQLIKKQFEGFTSQIFLKCI